MATTEEWVHENGPVGRQSPVILTSIELEEDLVQPNSPPTSTAASVFDDILGESFRSWHLARFYVLQETELQAWAIPVSSVSSSIHRKGRHTYVITARNVTQCHKFLDLPSPMSP